MIKVHIAHCIDKQYFERIGDYQFKIEKDKNQRGINCYENYNHGMKGGKKNVIFSI